VSPLTNHLGFAFEHYDQWGVWRDTEKGLAIDTTGELARPLSAADACSLSQLEPAFAAGKIRELLLALSLTDGFLYRPLAVAAP
jgi:hypothetical protein